MNLQTIDKIEFDILIAKKIKKFSELEEYIKNTFNLSTKIIFNKNKII
jgi:hypothetical protein